MSQYLLSTYMVEGEVRGGPQSPEEMQAFMQRIIALEAEMDEKGSDPLMTDGPFAESKEHLGGFYILNAEDLDEALAWAGQVADATNHAIEVRPFRATGKAADHMGGMPDA